MKRKRKRDQKRATQPIFVFAPASLQVTQEAMHEFEQSFARVQGQQVQLAFAHETMLRVKSKLDQMQTSVGAFCLITFDSNEKLVLATATQQYIVRLLFQPVSVEQQRVLRLCRQVKQCAMQSVSLHDERSLFSEEKGSLKRGKGL